MLYDFQDPVTFWNDVFYWDEETWEEESVIASSEIIQVGNHLAKKYVFLEGADYVIEGIGVDCLYSGYTLYPFKPKWVGANVQFLFRYLVEDGEIVYKGMNYEQLSEINEAVAERTRPMMDDNYYNLMGLPVGKDVPTTPGIYIHQGKKIAVR